MCVFVCVLQCALWFSLPWWVSAVPGPGVAVAAAVVVGVVAVDVAAAANTAAEGTAVGVG